MSRTPLVAVLFLAAIASGEEPLINAGHQDLTWYTSAEGQRQVIQSVADWERRKSEILHEFETAAGPLPSRETLPPLDIEETEAQEFDGHVRITVTFASEPGDRLSAYLYVSQVAASEKRAGIVALHPTHKIGKGVVDGQGPRPNRAYAKELAERGHIVIAPDYPSFGDKAVYDFSADRYRSGTMKGIWNHMRCVDLLLSRDDVDPERIGAIGHSLGGHNAIFLGVFDPRVKAVVSSCGWTPFHDYYGGDIKGWTSDRYLPALRDDYGLDPDKVPFDFHELVAALAPRAFFSNSPLFDANFDYRGVEKAAPKIRRIYELYGEPDRLRIAYPNADHDFPPQVREEAYEFLEKALNP